MMGINLTVTLLATAALFAALATYFRWQQRRLDEEREILNRLRLQVEKGQESLQPTPGRAEAGVEEFRAQPRILIVDDEPINRVILSQQLLLHGYQVEEAADGPEALEQIEKSLPDLVLLDVMMPELSGFDVCRQLRRRYAPLELPVIFVTAKSQSVDQVHGFEAGGNDYLTKPVDQDTLVAHVHTHLQFASAYRQVKLA